MCTEIYLSCRRISVGRQGELANVVGEKALVRRRGYGRRDANWRNFCLCPIDVRKTLERAAFLVDDSEGMFVRAWEPGYKMRIDRERYEAAMSEMRATNATPHKP